MSDKKTDSKNTPKPPPKPAAKKQEPLKKDIPSLAPKDIREVLEKHGVGLDADESKKVADALTRRIS